MALGEAMSWPERTTLSEMHEESITVEITEELAALQREVAILKSLSVKTNLAEDEFAHFFTHSIDLLCIAGFDGYFKRLNPAWMICLGRTLEELEARPFLDFVHPEDRKSTVLEVGAIADGGETILFENRYRHRNGSYRWLSWNGRAIPGRQEIYAIAQDVTRQKRQEREILEIADREKERLGCELHDGLCQTLAGIAALGATLSRTLAARSGAAESAAAAEITGLLQEAISEARDLARGLSPLGLNEAGLGVALQELTMSVQHRFRVFCTLECNRNFPRLGEETAAHLFRIAQEAVSNAVAHGRADRVEISLSNTNGEGVLIVRDNGVGVSEETPRGAGIGLHTMRYRARLIGASLEVRRRTRRGTAVTCAFPLPPKADTREKLCHARHRT